MDKIIVVSKNKGIVSKDELFPFAIDLKSSLNVQVEFYTPKHLGTQVTFHDVIEVWLLGKVLDKIIDRALEKTIDAFIEWAKKRLSLEENRRPKSLSIYDEKGKKIKSITIDTKGEVEDNTAKEKLLKPTAPKTSEPFDEKKFDEKKDDNKDI